MVNCWVQFSDGAVAPLELFDRSVYSLTVSTHDQRVATVRRTPQSTFAVAQGEGEGRARQVRVELRICEECQKSKRKSKLVVGAAILKTNFQSSRSVTGGGGGANRNKNVGGSTPKVINEPKATAVSQNVVGTLDRRLVRGTIPNQQSTVAERSMATTTSNKYVQTYVVGTGTTKAIGGTVSSVFSIATPSTRSKPGLNTQPNTIKPTAGVFSKGEGLKKPYGNMLDNSNSSSNIDTPETETPKKEVPKSKMPNLIESDLIRTFRSMSDLEIGMYALVGVSCVAILAFLINCASYKLCFRKQKTPIQAGPAPNMDLKDHKHDWVWLGSGSHSAPAPAAPVAPAQASTLKREPHHPLESHHSIDSMGPCSGSLLTVSAPPVPERTATLGRSRTSSQQLQFQGKAVDLLANRSATLLARPQRSEPLHSPTSKRNQVQFTTFTTLDIKHLSALKKNGMDLTWANQQAQQQQQAPAEPQIPLPDMPWPVVKPVGET